MINKISRAPKVFIVPWSESKQSNIRLHMLNCR